MADLYLKTLDIPATGNTYSLVQPDGSYPYMTAGSAEQIISDDYTENKVPYLLRASGGNGSKREEDTLVGGTVAWNQNVVNGGMSAQGSFGYGGGTIAISGGTLKYTFSTVYNNQYSNQIYQPLTPYFPAGHVFFTGLSVKPSHSCPIQMWLIANSGNNAYNQGWRIGNATAGVWNRVERVARRTSYDSANRIQICIENASDSGFAVGDEVEFDNIVLIDLTAMFGTTIADYIYALEQANAGAGVAWFKKLFPKPYYAYNAGELMSVSGVSAHKMVGKNLLNTEAIVGGILNASGVVNVQSVTIGEKTKTSITWTASDTWRGVTSDYISVTAGKHYFLSLTETVSYVIYAWYDSSKTFISRATYNGGSMQSVEAPNNAAFVRYTLQEATAGTFTYHNIQLESGSSATTYEPYNTWSYPLDDSLTLRGIPKLDANNSLYYDGDTYESDGTVTRKYGIVDLGTLTWQKYTNGANWGFYADISGAKSHTASDVVNAVCSRFKVVTPVVGASDFVAGEDNTISGNGGAAGRYIVKCTAYSDAATFKTAMSGVYFVYELATTTTETADPFTNPQTVDPDGTEEYVSTGIVPVGHDTKYYADLVERLAAIPEPPTSNGTYRLIATVSGGVATLSWVNN